MTQAPTPGPLSGFQKGDVVCQLDWNAITTVDDVLDQGAHVGVTLDGKYGVWPASRFTFIGRPDADDWMPWSGGENPVPGQMVDWRPNAMYLRECVASEAVPWSQAFKFRLAPTAPVEASGSELADAIERVDRWANYPYTYADTVAVDSPLSTFTAGDLRLILSAIRPQPSGETRPTDEEIRSAIKATEYKYFGDYEFTEDQHAAVDVLVRAGQALAALKSTAAKEA